MLVDRAPVAWRHRDHRLCDPSAINRVRQDHEVTSAVARFSDRIGRVGRGEDLLTLGQFEPTVHDAEAHVVLSVTAKSSGSAAK